jgi:hypothetical protein
MRLFFSIYLKEGEKISLEKRISVYMIIQYGITMKNGDHITLIQYITNIN